MQNIIAWVAIGCAILCIVVYAILTLSPVVLAWKKYKAPAKPPAGRPTLGPVQISFPDLVKAFASLVDALAKAGPGLWSLIGSMLFLLIASLAAGVFSAT